MTLRNQVVTQTVACPVRINSSPVDVVTRPTTLDKHGTALRSYYYGYKKQIVSHDKKVAE